MPQAPRPRAAIWTTKSRSKNSDSQALKTQAGNENSFRSTDIFVLAFPMSWEHIKRGIRKSAKASLALAGFLSAVWPAVIPQVAEAAETVATGDMAISWTILGVGVIMGIALTLIVFSLRRVRDHGRALKEGRLFRDVADFAGDWVWEMDADLRFTYLSARFFELFPIAPESILGKTRGEYTGADADDRDWRNHFRDLGARRPFRDFKYSHKDGEGRTRHIRISGRPVFDTERIFKGYQGTGTDLTAEIEATAQAARAKATLADAIASISAGFALFDSEDRLVLCNNQYRDAHPLVKELALPGTPFEDIVRGFVRAGQYDPSMGKAEAWVKQRMEYHRNPPSNHEQCMADGRWLHVSEFGTHDGGTVLLLTDITERKRSEAALEESEERFRNLIEGSVQGVLIHVDHKPQFANQAYADIFGYDSPEEVVAQKSALEHVALRERDRMKAYNYARVRGEDAPATYVFEGIRKDGTRLWLENRGRAVTWKGQTAVQRTVVDITERKQAEEDLRLAKEAAEIANRVKSEFLANMSHELRTPLNSVIGFSEMIKDQILGPDKTSRYREYAADIFASGKHLLGLISDILDVSKIEAGEMDIAVETIDVGEVIEICARMIRERADKAEVTLTIGGAEGCPALLGDERRLKQILLNLLSNAVKFTPPRGKVSIGAGLTKDGGVRLWVADTGIGIAPEDISMVLKPFGQVEPAFYKSHDGAGLGLSLAKSLSELQGSELMIESEPGQGTTVSVLFPAEKNRRR